MSNPYTFGRNPEIPLVIEHPCNTCKNCTEQGCVLRFCQYEEKEGHNDG